MKKILITGAGSYIGTSFEKWVAKWPDQYQADTVDMKGDSWRKMPFSGYDTVFHVAGIAHVSKDPKLQDLYFKVNRDLAVETAKKAKAEGVSQFIFMSSIIVYGDSAPIGLKRVITRDTMPRPSNFYGQSKLEAEQGIFALADERFHVAVLRPPMIYGKGCKGNYPKLAMMAKKMFFFPKVDNERSALYIGNLCEFLRLIVNHEEEGVFFPQNADYISTSHMAAHIAGMHGRKMILVKGINGFLRLVSFVLPVITKVFGSIVYEKNLSAYRAPYQLYDFAASMEGTEMSACCGPYPLYEFPASVEETGMS